MYLSPLLLSPLGDRKAALTTKMPEGKNNVPIDTTSGFDYVGNFIPPAATEAKASNIPDTQPVGVLAHTMTIPWT